MTVEEYIASQLDGSVTADRIEFARFEGESSYYCDTCGPSGFATIIHYRVRKEGGYVSQYGNIDRTMRLDEDDVTDFLRAMFPDEV